MLTENELTKKYFPFLDELRALAIFWVILHHLPTTLPNWAEQIRIRGDLGVELFFSISSFLVFRSLHQCILKKSKDKYEFLKRRVFRIFPPYFLTLTMILTLSFFDKGLGQKLFSIKDILLSFPLFYYNYAKTYTLGNVPGSLNVLWSLCFEEQFYISLFLVSRFFPKKITIIMIFGVLFSVILRIFYYFNDLTITSPQLQMQTHLRLDAILLGCLIYYYWNSLKRFFNFTALNIIFVILAVFLHKFIDYQYQGLLYTLISFSFTFLIFNLLNQHDKWPAHFLKNAFLRNIGIISFEIYLLHEIIVGVAVKIGLKPYPLLFILFTYIFSITSAWLMHRLFSKPLNDFLRQKYISATV